MQKIRYQENESTWIETFKVAYRISAKNGINVYRGYLVFSKEGVEVGLGGTGSQWKSSEIGKF